VTARSTESFPKTSVSIPSPVRRIADAYGVIAVGAALLVWLALEDGGYGGVARHASGVIVWLALFGLLLARGTAALPRGPVLVVAGAIAAFAALTGLSMLWSESVGRSFVELDRVLIYLGVFLVVAALGSGSPRRRGQLLEALTLGMAVVVVLATLSRVEPALFPDQPLQTLAPAFRARLAYPLGYWNAVGSLTAITLVLVIYAASRADRPRAYRAAATAVLPGAGLALYLTFSRGSLVAAAVACLVMLWLSPRRLSVLGSAVIGGAGAAVLVLVVHAYAALDGGLLDQSAARSEGHRVLVLLVVVSAATYGVRLLAERSALPRRVADALAPHGKKAAIAVGVVVVAGAVAAAPKIADRAAEFREPVVAPATTASGAEGRLTSGSANGRYQYWSSSWDAWKSRPVAGRGAGTWEFWWRRHATIDSPTRDSHSLFFDVLAELGTLGVLALLAFVGAALWFCAAAVRAADAAARPGLVAVTAGALAWTIGAAIDWSWEVTALTIPFFVLVALAASARADQIVPASGERRRSPAIGAVALAAWIAVVMQAVGLGADWSLQRSENEVARGDLAAATESADLARTIEPWSAEPYMQQALVRSRGRSDVESVRLARKALDREPTNWRAWLVLTTVEARAGLIGQAQRDAGIFGTFARGSPLKPTYQQLLMLSVGEDPGFRRGP
jgi:hypothetical protein